MGKMEFLKSQLADPKFSFLLFITPEIGKSLDDFLNKLSQIFNFKPVKVTDNYLKNIITTDLLEPLLELVTPTLALELNSAKKRGYLDSSNSQQSYNLFIEQLSEQNNKLQLFKKYPLLLNKIEIIFNNFLTANLDFFEKLTRDSDEITKEFFHNQDLVLDDVFSAGDSHCYGQSTKIIKFVSAVDNNQPYKIIYKPHSLELDLAVHRFYDWLNSKTDVKLLTYRILSKKNYGWCEFVKYASCDNTEQLKEYYRKLGGLLTISYVLSGHDIHCENVIASGSDPVIIDNECFLSPIIIKDVKQKIRPLVSNSMILPQQITSKDKKSSYDVSAMGPNTAIDKTINTKVWGNYGIDDVRMIEQEISSPKYNNMPLLNNSEINIADYYQDFISGFEYFYHLFLANKDELLSANSPLDFFKNSLHPEKPKVISRVLFKTTPDYYLVLKNSYHPRLLFNKQEHDKYLNNNLNFNKNLSDSLLKAEIHSINNNDIPYFYCRSDEAEVYSDQGVLLDIEIIPGLDVARAVIRNLSIKDLKLQRVIINNKLKYSGNTKTILANSYFKNDDKKLTIDQYSIIDKIKQIINHLNDTAIDDGYLIKWPTLILETVDNSFQSGFSGADLYDGILGQILMNLSAGQLIDGCYYKIADDYLASYQDYILRAKANNNIGSFSIGGYGEIGGGIFVLSQMLKDNYFNNKIHDLNNIINILLGLGIGKIKNDQIFDLVGGCSGYLLQLLNLKKKLFTDGINKNLLDNSISLCVEHLLNNYIKDFQSLDYLISFSHGTLGVSYALSKYYESMLDKNKHKKILNWLKQVSKYEHDKLINIQPTDWLSTNAANNHRWHCNNSWCHGTVGIGLAKLYQYGLFDKSLYAKDIKFALENTKPENYSQNNIGLCHGYLGTSELFLQAYQNNLISKSDYDFNRDEILLNVFDVLDSRDSHHYDFSGLMVGQAGVAYQLLRLAYPDRVASVLF